MLKEGLKASRGCLKKGFKGVWRGGSSSSSRGSSSSSKYDAYENKGRRSSQQGKPVKKSGWAGAGGRAQRAMRTKKSSSGSSSSSSSSSGSGSGSGSGGSSGSSSSSSSSSSRSSSSSTSQRKLGSNTSEVRTNRILSLEMMKGGARLILDLEGWCAIET